MKQLPASFWRPRNAMMSKRTHDGVEASDLMARAKAVACILGVTLLFAPAMPEALAQTISASQAGGLSMLGAMQPNVLPAANVPNISISTTPAASGSPPAAPGPATATAQQAFYTSNQNSNVFGANLFTGAFTRLGPTQFNPDYSVALGDSIQVRLWGSFQLDSLLNVDPEGNIFVPNVGPVHVLGLKNKDIQHVVESAISKVFRSNVLSYATLAAAQPVRVFVGGFVNLPGMYNGTSMDSLLNYLDQAGGIDPARGSFLDVQVKRGEMVRASFNLYDFLLDGKMPMIQLADGDVILVSSRKNTITVSNFSQNANLFEFMKPDIPMTDVVKLARPFSQANHVLVTRNDAGPAQNTEYYSLEQAGEVMLHNGDAIQFTSDKMVGTISVRVQGEHLSNQVYALPHGARLGDLMKKIHFADTADADSIQLFRQSVQARQAQQLQSLISSLQANVLTSRSGTAGEENVRTQESARMLQWVNAAKQIQPSGQVLIAQTEKRNDLLLENGDVINIPAKDGLVVVSGQVLFPTSITFDDSMSLDDYIRRCGGFTQGADVARVIVAHRDGSFSDTSDKGLFRSTASIREGDTILVLPYVDPKSRQFWLEMTQIISQVAISAKIVLGL